MTTTIPTTLNWRPIEYSARTAVAATVSLMAARFLGLPESYWAAISTLIVMQSTLGATLQVSAQRFVGTALGAVTGAILGNYVGPNWVSFSAGVFALGVICAVLHLDRSGYRYAGIALTIVLMVDRNLSPWKIAAHRFTEVSAGVFVGLLVTLAWPERSQPIKN